MRYITFFLFFYSFCCFAQKGTPLGNRSVYNDFFDMGNVGYELNSKMGKTQFDSAFVPYIVFHPVREEVSSGILKINYPSAIIPIEKFQITFPDMSECSDTLGVLWSLTSQNNVNVINNLMLIGTSTNGNERYYVDYNNNRSFLDDGPPFQFDWNQKQKKIDIEDKRNGSFSFLLLNLNEGGQKDKKNSYEIDSKQNVGDLEKDNIIKKTKRRNFNFGFIASVMSSDGTSGLSFKPQLDPHREKIEYKAKIASSFVVTGGINFSFKSISIGAILGCEKIEFSERKRIEWTLNPKTYVYTEDVTNNTGLWPDYLTFYGLFLEYNFNISKNFIISPYADYVKSNFQNSSTFDGEFSYSQTKFTDSYSFSYGGKFKVIASPKSKISFNLLKKESYFDGSSNFKNIEKSSFKSTFSQIQFGLGYEFLIL